MEYNSHFCYFCLLRTFYIRTFLHTNFFTYVLFLLRIISDGIVQALNQSTIYYSDGARDNVSSFQTLLLSLLITAIALLIMSVLLVVRPAVYQGEANKEGMIAVNNS